MAYLQNQWGIRGVLVRHVPSNTWDYHACSTFPRKGYTFFRRTIFALIFSSSKYRGVSVWRFLEIFLWLGFVVDGGLIGVAMKTEERELCQRRREVLVRIGGGGT